MPSDKCGLLPPEAFFEQIYASHRQSLHAYFLGRTGDGEVALDLLQEIFLRAWRNLARLQEKAADQQRYWLFTVAKNLLTDYYRHQRVQTSAQTALHDQTLETLPTQKAPDAQIEVREQLQQLDQAIQQLPENLRTILLMQVLGDLNSTQIGDILELPAGTVRYQLAMARKRLSEALQLKEIGQLKQNQG
ncbi:MAG: RNA polymerase sigma factor [Chloroflexi bacterium]|nr:RNA polymerase sigma factor [Chloroflexota bacterium]